MRKAHPLPQRGQVFQEDPLARHRRTGQQKEGSLLLQAGAAGFQGGKPDHRRADGHAGQRHAGVEVERERGQAEHHGLVGFPNDQRKDHKANGHADHAAQDAGGQAVKEVFAYDLCVGVSQGFQGAHLQAVLVHHAGHGGGGHQRRHQEEEHREHPRNGGHPVGILFKGDKTHGAAPVQHIPLAGLDVVDLLLGIGDLLLAVGKLLFGLGFLRLVFGTGSFQLFLAGVVLGPALVQPGAGGIELGVSGGGAGGELQLPLQQLHFHPAQSGLGFGDQVGVGKAGRGDQPLGVHLLFACVQLGLIAVELAADVVVGGLRLSQGIPQLGVFFILRFGFVQCFLRVVQGRFGVAKQGVGHLLQIDQQLDLLELVLKFQYLFLTAHQRVGPVFHRVGQGGFLGGKFGFACVQLSLGGGEPGLGIGKLLFGFRELAFGLGFLFGKGLFGFVQPGGSIVDELGPAGGTLCRADGREPVGHGIHSGLVFVRIIVVQIGVFRLDVTNSIIICGQLAVLHEHHGIQNAVTRRGGFLPGGKILRILHPAHHGILGAAGILGVIGQGERGAQRDEIPVAQHLNHTLVGALGQPTLQNKETVHVVRGVGLRVCAQLLHPHHRAVAGGGPLAHGIQILYGHHGADPLGGGNGGDVVLRKAQRGKDAQVEHILLGVEFLPGGAHTGRKAGQTCQHHHAQKHDAKQGKKSAQIAFEIPQDVFAITFLHSTHHSICSTGTGCSLT